MRRLVARYLGVDNTFRSFSTLAIMTADYKLFAGSANRDLTEAVARQLNIELGDCTIQRFPDGEVGVELNESVREQKVRLRIRKGDS
jgi:phosphoribosylpyrophosphate synthetase